MTTTQPSLLFHPSTTAHTQQQPPMPSSQTPSRVRTLTHRRGSLSARDPFEIYAQRERDYALTHPDARTKNGDEDRQMTSRLTIVRVIPRNPEFDPNTSPHLSNRPPDTGTVRTRSLGTQRRVSFASSSFSAQVENTGLSSSSRSGESLSRSHSSSSIHSHSGPARADRSQPSPQSSPDTHTIRLHPPGPRRRSASVSTQTPFRIAQRYGYSTRSPEPLTPEQVIDIAKASLFPDPKTLLSFRDAKPSIMTRSRSASDIPGMSQPGGVGAEGVGVEQVEPANFMPMEEGQFLPFIDRPKEVAQFLASPPTDRLIALLEQAFPNHLRLPRDHPDRHVSPFSPSEAGQTLPKPSPTLTKALMSDPPLATLGASSPTSPSFPSPIISTAFEASDVHPAQQSGDGEAEDEPRPHPHSPLIPRYFDHPQTWSFPTLLAWMCTVPREMADDKEWVRRIRRCVMERTEKICVVLMGALGVPLENEGEELQRKINIQLEEAVGGDEYEEMEVEGGEEQEMKRSRSDGSMETATGKLTKAVLKTHSEGSATPSGKIRSGGATPIVRVQPGVATPRLALLQSQSGISTPRLVHTGGSATPRTSKMPDDGQTIDAVLNSVEFGEPKAKRPHARIRFGDAGDLEDLERRQRKEKREREKREKKEAARKNAVAHDRNSPRHPDLVDDESDIPQTDYFHLDIEPIELVDAKSLEPTGPVYIHSPELHLVDEHDQGVFIHRNQSAGDHLAPEAGNMFGAGGKPRSNSESSFTSSSSGSGSVSGSGLSTAGRGKGSRLSWSGSTSSHMEAIGESEDESEDSEAMVDDPPSVLKTSTGEQAQPADALRKDENEQTQSTMGRRPNKQDMERLQQAWATAAHGSSPKPSTPSQPLSPHHTHHEHQHHGPYYGLTLATNPLPSSLAPLAIVSAPPEDHPMPVAIASRMPPPASLLNPSVLHSEPGSGDRGHGGSKAARARRNTVSVAHILTGAPGYKGYSWRLGGPLFPKSFDAVAEFGHGENREVTERIREQKGQERKVLEEKVHQPRADPGDGLLRNINARSSVAAAAASIPRISSPRPRVARPTGGKSALSKLAIDVPVFTPPNSPVVQRW